MCGVIKGKAHAPFCPYPYYGNKTKEESAWMDAFRKMKSKSPLKIRMSGKGAAKRFAEEIIKQVYDPAYVYPAPIFPRFNCDGKVIIDEMVDGLHSLHLTLGILRLSIFYPLPKLILT